MRRRFGADAGRVDHIAGAMNHVFVKRVFHEGASVADAPQAASVAFVLREQHRRLVAIRVRTDGQTEIAQSFVRGCKQVLVLLTANARLQGAAFVGAAPRPGVAIPECRQQVQRRLFRAAIGRCYANQDIVGSIFRVFGKDIKVTVVLENHGVPQLELRFILVAPSILLDQ